MDWNSGPKICKSIVFDKPFWEKSRPPSVKIFGNLMKKWNDSKLIFIWYDCFFLFKESLSTIIADFEK